ncbi:MAG: neutral/alkaline non-lysosomal ceramidase N-terminal domain-containing protein [Oscillospiraceae bacterium]|nr:neutral/alkaline non-lysosomal ceramidase N-terminal domain-containing protein [Oscillospiraceae bacterium]
MNEQLRIGVGKRDITPKVGRPLFGYRPDIFSKSVNDALTATAVAFCQNDTKAMIISATLGVFKTELADKIQRVITEKTKIPHVILSATHTHSGPNTSGITGWGDIDHEYCDDILLPRLTEAAAEAACSLRDAKLGIGVVKSRVGINRRQHGADGKISLGQNPWGIYDDTMTVLRFAEPCGKPLASIVHYGAHCTAAGANTEITRDWAGFMLDRLEKESGAPAAFINGGFGDVGPRLSNGATTGDISHAGEIGGMAALDAVLAWKNSKNTEPANLSVKTGELILPLKARLPREEAQKLFEQTNENAVNIEAQKHRYYKNVLASYQNKEPEEKQLIIPQTLVSLGNVVFVPFMFEVFSEITMRLRHYSPYEHTLCMGTANGYEHYLPSQDQLCRGGYEVGMFQTSRVQSLCDNTDDIIIRENLKLMENMKK